MRSLKSQPNIKMQHTYSTTPAVKAEKVQYGQKKPLGSENLTCSSVFLSFCGLVPTNVEKFVSPSKDRVRGYCAFLQTLRLQLTVNRDGTDFSFFLTRCVMSVQSS